MIFLERNLLCFEARGVPCSHEFEIYNFSDFECGQDFALMTVEDNAVAEV